MEGDYCGVSGVAEGTDEALYAAVAAATIRVPTLAMQPPNPTDFTALQPTLVAPFLPDEAKAIANAVVRALQLYRNSKHEAVEAATYLAQQQHIHPPGPQ